MKGSPRARKTVFPSQSRDSLATLAEVALSVHHLHVVNDYLVPTSTMNMKISIIASFHALGLGCPQTAYLMPIYSMPAFSRQPVPGFPSPSQTGVLPLRSAMPCTHRPHCIPHKLGDCVCLLPQETISPLRTVAWYHPYAWFFVSAQSYSRKEAGDHCLAFGSFPMLAGTPASAYVY